LKGTDYLRERRGGDPGRNIVPANAAQNLRASPADVRFAEASPTISILVGKSIPSFHAFFENACATAWSGLSPKTGQLPYPTLPLWRDHLKFRR